MYVNFEIAALFPSPYSRAKKSGKFKTNIYLVSVDSFLYYLSSSTPSITLTSLHKKAKVNAIAVIFGYCHTPNMEENDFDQN